ncbi:MAG: SDR family NAD(P)-dependent oxidoreductase [Rickettsiales bacterium]|nr:SDR family NAD(P)-dependent oxidoreductase [Pseudomonadota bacterium]MDA0967410.1 SDR family NAD(P)-dependent oxidoreductase [Pseudomonadota bacterium]MDG4544222.1 SDR family NAD(P)-dependent oxidoreductase [Rickettsiales bacterium]MDG4546403.1 SDR family NAD(P)-dependent oxidoreductase [Rickettsiales bacterium]MDG4548546.1 SDR family NAD(P)-dependent oxidoreductase [Rickettsiales bacterium]
MSRLPNKILITGASSGIGAELAKQYAAEGINLYLTARNEKRLKEVKKVCTAKKAKVHIKILDIKDKAELTNWISSIDELDLVIANAGISAGTGGGGESVEQVENIFSTNIDGVIHTIHPAIDIMRKQKRGQIAIISSLAGYRGLPSSPAYSASKAAVRVYGEALRGTLQKEGIKLSVITPGYIKTPMTDVNDFPMPFLMDVDKAASIIIKKLKKNPARIAFPFPLYFIIWLVSCLPPVITDPIFARLPEKPSQKPSCD